MLKKHKPLFAVILTVFILSVLMSLCSCASNKSKDEPKAQPDNLIHSITDNIYLEKLNSTRHNIFICQNSDLSENDRNYIEQNVYIFKFSNDDRRIAYHMNDLSIDNNTDGNNVRQLGGAVYKITNDIFVIYDFKDNKRNTFYNEDDFYSYCRYNNLDLFNWRFSNGLEYNNHKLSDNWSLLSCESVSVTDQILKNDQVVLEGFVSEYDVVDGYIVFRLEMPKKCLLEFPDRFENMIDNETKKVGKHCIGVFLYEDIYFDKYVVINCADDQLDFFNDIAEAKQYISKQF